MSRGKYIRTKEILDKYSNSQKGKHHTEKTKEKMRLSHLNNPNSGEFKKGEVCGDKNLFWKGGSKGYWRRQALIRDDYTCQICGFRNVDIMIVDHKLPKCKYPELKFNLDNLQTLCPNCNQIKTIRELKNKEY